MDIIDIKYLIKHLINLNSKQISVINNLEEWYYFMHIPKTAGTSIRYALFEQFSSNHVYPNHVDYYIKNKAKYIYPKDFEDKHKDILKPHIKLLIGHFGIFPIINCRKTKPRTFAFFRDPVARVISELNYHSKKGRRYYGLTLKEKIAISKRNQGMVMALQLGYKRNKKNIEEAIDNFKHIEVVCLTEYFSESIEILNKTFNWKLSNNYHRNKHKSSIQLEDSHVEEIREFCEVDIIIYQKAKEIFFEQ